MCETCTELLSQGLDLCVRARKLDAQHRSNVAVKVSVCGEEWEKSGVFEKHVIRNNIENPHREMMTKSATIPVWLQDKYERDLHEWEQKSRHHLMQGCAKTIR